MALFKMNVKSFNKKSMQRHTLLKDAVDFVVSEVEGPSDVFIVGPPTGGGDSDVEWNDDEDLTENNTLPVEVAGEIDICFEEEEEKEAEVQPPNKDEANSKRKEFLLVRNNESIRTKEEDNI